MIRLPLYPENYRLEIETVAREERNKDCEKCGVLPQTVRTVCMQADGSPGGVLFLGEAPSPEDDKARKPLTGELRRKLVEIMEEARYDGPVAYDVALRCNPPESPIKKELKTWVDNCKPYLGSSLDRLAPKRVICLGPIAATALLGRAIDTYSSRRGVAWIGDTPVFWVPAFKRATGNRFFMSRFEADIEWALRVDLSTLPRPPLDGHCLIIESVEDAEAAERDIRAAGALTLDVETAGKMYDHFFSVLCVSFTPRGKDTAWVWPEAALKNPLIFAVYRRLLEDPSLEKGGQNGKYDVKAIRYAHGIMTANYGPDSHLMRRALYSDAKADLNTIGELVGMGGHKLELKGVLLKARASINTARKKVKEGKLEVGDLTDALLRRACEMTKLKADAFAYGLVARTHPQVLWRYNALDTISTDRAIRKCQPEVAGAVHPGRKTHDLAEHYARLIMRLTPTIAQIEHWGMPVDRVKAMAADAFVAEKLAAARDKLAEFKPGLNPRSTPQLVAYLFGELGLPPQKSFKQKKTDAPSVDAHTLKALKDKHPFAAALLEFRKLDKTRGTYTLGLQQFMTPDDRVHATLNPGGTKTGRLSSQDPNLQNLGGGKEEADKLLSKMIKDIFTASPGHVLLQLDYSQLELRVAALLCEDLKMLEIFLSGQDYHMATAKTVAPVAWGLTPDKVTKAHRSMVKAVVFGLLYGMTDQGLAMRLNISVDQAAKLRQAIFGGFPKLYLWYQRMHRYAAECGMCLTYWKGQPARRRPLLDIADCTGRTRWDGSEELTPGKRKALNASINTPVQGTASDFMLMSLCDITDAILANNWPAKLVMSVHDSAIIEVREDFAEEMATFARTTMEGQGWGEVPIAVDVERGYAWGSMSKWEPDKARKLVVKARKAEGDRDFAEALSLYKKAADCDDTNADAVAGVARLETAV